MLRGKLGRGGNRMQLRVQFSELPSRGEQFPRARDDVFKHGGPLDAFKNNSLASFHFDELVDGGDGQVGGVNRARDRKFEFRFRGGSPGLEQLEHAAFAPRVNFGGQPLVNERSFVDARHITWWQGCCREWR